MPSTAFKKKCSTVSQARRLLVDLNIFESYIWSIVVRSFGIIGIAELKLLTRTDKCNLRRLTKGGSYRSICERKRLLRYLYKRLCYLMLVEAEEKADDARGRCCLPRC